MIKIRTNKSKIISIFFGILFLVLINSNNFRHTLLPNDNAYNNEINLKNAGFWNLTGNPILIDDTNPSKNWSYSASHYDWCSGSGIWTDPYLIENITIDSQNISSCIEIRNSNAYFMINNCTVYSSGTANYGIYLNYTNNGKIINNNCSVYFGIFLDRSNNITVLGNDISNNQYGIAVSFSNNTIISENLANNNLIADIAFQWSRNATLTKNILTSEGKEFNFGGLFLPYSSSQEELASYSIDTTNLINGKPIYYYANEKGLGPNDFLNAGQIILVNCNDSLISNVNIADIYQGITIMYGNNNTILNSSLDNTYHGILVITNSFDNVISGNIMKNCYYGITLYYDNNTIISRNVIEKSYWGIYISSVYNTTVSENIVSDNNDIGILISNCNNSEISKNSVENNNKGIYLSSSKENVVSRNIIRNNKEHGVYISENIDPSPSTQNLFFQNSFLNNSVHAYDDGIDNYWNNSIIGNYWDNYTGIDSNDDGIGDTPHTFQNGTDYLPIVDITAPTIIINLPMSLEAFGETAPDFNVEITDVLLDTMWYTLDNGLTNTTFTSNDTINQALWNALPEGNVTIRFYAKDSAGNIEFAEVTIRKDISTPDPPPDGIPGYNLIFLLGIISIITIIIVKKRLNRLN